MSLQRLAEKQPAELREFIDRVDAAVAAGACALYYDAKYQVINLDLFTWSGTEFSEDEWSDAADEADALDQLIVFAFGGAPREYVAEWTTGVLGEEVAEKFGDLVEYMRGNMPALEAEWNARRGTFAPSLGDVSAAVIYAPGEDQIAALVRLDSFFSQGPRLAPISSTRKHFEARLSRADMRRIITVLGNSIARIDRYEEATSADD